MSKGIHHVTAISGPAQCNLDFHAKVLGQRLVKRTVNFDDPGTYHLYYGDAAGSPGSILTFFPWDGVSPGRLGAGETLETSFRVPAGSFAWWTERLRYGGAAVEAPVRRFGASVLSFTDPDGMRLALVGLEGIGAEPHWEHGGVPAEHALRGFHGVTLLVNDAAPTAGVLTDVMGFVAAGKEGATSRFLAPDVAIGGVVDLRVEPGLPRGRQGGGSVHHVAFRAADDAAQAEMVRKLRNDHGLATTEQKDRNYFRSVYLREPGGVIFEIATDQPGFAVDEPGETLGQSLKLPSFLESDRARIQAVLPELAG
ncbi:ring-cleaving dioxygenase [Lichenihabitans sp. Uapishka_5]|uniref:ring-cleaving dioxygenase n=1 Tax=Lichenihabitans sp. Uapishka_5 TaxID=3037302 RepID=UPI0029E7D50C|nr:ring-cleaving dioxygenase [Lichenihabitans sp. Uapishka_5]MDX7951826.1 ring-cleaving dioxygenase [Lichenihabitans sp. Uapishka_5]